jgi:hypothetical protein
METTIRCCFKSYLFLRGFRKNNLLLNIVTEEENRYNWGHVSLGLKCATS